MPAFDHHGGTQAVTGKVGAVSGGASQYYLVFPFYNEEVHLLARREIRRFEDLDGKRVVVGTSGERSI